MKIVTQIEVFGSHALTAETLRRLERTTERVLNLRPGSVAARQFRRDHETEQGHAS